MSKQNVKKETKTISNKTSFFEQFKIFYSLKLRENGKQSASKSRLKRQNTPEIVNMFNSKTKKKGLKLSLYVLVSLNMIDLIKKNKFLPFIKLSKILFSVKKLFLLAIKSNNMKIKKDSTKNEGRPSMWNKFQGLRSPYMECFARNSTILRLRMPR